VIEEISRVGERAQHKCVDVILFRMKSLSWSKSLFCFLFCVFVFSWDVAGSKWRGW